MSPRPAQPRPLPSSSALPPSRTRWATGLAGGTALLGLPLVFISVFLFSPTQCPDTGGSYLCRYPSMQGGSIMILAAGFAVAVGLALVSGRVREHRRSVQLRVASVALTGLLLLGTVLAASSW